MSATTTEDPPERIVKLQLPRKLRFLMEMHPYKVAYGGRNSLKSWSFARALLTLGIHQDLRILCAREVQKSLADSVHLLLTDQIKALGYGEFYEVVENAIRCTVRDTMFRFSGLSDQTADSIKSFEGFDIAWIEEAQSVTKRSWQILLPTIFRKENSEVWVSFNPDMDSDETYKRFVVSPAPGAVVVHMNYRDAIACGWWTDEQERLRQYDLVHSPDDYDNIWEGRARTVVAGAIYTNEIGEMIRDQRFRPIPYDPRFPVHRVWDLGWDVMAVVMVQKPHPSALNVVNYAEDSRISYAVLIETMDRLGYRWGVDWLPHDGTHHDPKSGTNAQKLLRGLTGRMPKLVPRSDPEARIKAARMMFPRVYMDDTKRDTPPERPDQLMGAGQLMDRLKRYKRNVPKTTNEPTGPVHDINSHAADAWGGLAEIVDQIRNDGDVPEIKLPAFANVNPSMGMLG